MNKIDELRQLIENFAKENGLELIMVILRLPVNHEGYWG
jgi:hypothetical protein